MLTLKFCVIITFRVFLTNRLPVVGYMMNLRESGLVVGVIRCRYVQYVLVGSMYHSQTLVL
jgi:hypothetical protein